MTPSPRSEGAIRSGDVDGRSWLYNQFGELLPELDEKILKVATGWDVTATTPWRRLLPSTIFLGFNKPTTSRLYITSHRVVLIRDIDPWRQVAGDMTPLGIPNAAATKVQLDRLKAEGIRQYCEIRTASLKLVRVKRSAKPGAWIGLRLIASNGTKYAVSLWKTDGEDRDTSSLIESLFQE